MIDLISKKDVINAISKELMEVRIGTAAAAAALRLCDYIEKMPAVKNRERTEWIPCSEQLPEEGEIVLCSIPADREYCARIAFGYLMFGRWEKSDWLGSVGEYGPMEPAPDAWMPMPKPYQSEKRTIRGIWINTPYADDDRVLNYKCSVCGKSFSYAKATEARPNFCMNCGADMRGDADEWTDDD